MIPQEMVEPIKSIGVKLAPANRSQGKGGNKSVAVDLEDDDSKEK
jgi:hypothetical protein